MTPSVAWQPMIGRQMQGRDSERCNRFSIERGWFILTDSHPDCKVAQDDDCQGNYTAGSHENNHVGLDSWVLAAAEHIRSAGGLQPMRPVPDV